MSILNQVTALGAVAGFGFLCSTAIMTSSAAASTNGIGTFGPYDVSVLNAVKYATPSADNLIECRPSARAGHFAGPYPAIMLIHGGGWGAGTSAIGPAYTGYSGSWCQLWASWGFDAFSVGYRLTGQAPWPAQIVDVQAAIRWLRANQQRLHLDGMVGVNGDSAGGQLAMIAGYSYRNVPGDLANNNAGMDSHPNLAISQFGPWTFGPANNTSTSTRAEDYAKQILVSQADGQTTETTTNTMFVQGTKDTTVNQCSQSEPAFRFLTSNHHPASYLAYSGGHEFSGMSGPTWATVVGEIQLKTISFAYARVHFMGLMPASERGPSLNFADSALPSGCP